MAQEEWLELFIGSENVRQKLNDAFGLFVNTSNEANGAIRPTFEYVLWIDIMGTTQRMSVSMQQSANFLLKLHQAIKKALDNSIESGKEELRVYPVMDAAYITSKTQRGIFNFINSLFFILALEFIRQENPEHQFLVRGCLSYGPIYHAMALKNWVKVDSDYKMSENDLMNLFLGIPVIQAHIFEKKAPPMGVFVHETARAFSPEGALPLSFVWDTWKSPEKVIEKLELSLKLDEYTLWKKLDEKITQYFEWAKGNFLLLDYPEPKIEAHFKLWKSYFNKRLQGLTQYKK